jgi:hypothetical protein
MQLNNHSEGLRTWIASARTARYYLLTYGLSRKGEPAYSLRAREYLSLVSAMLLASEWRFILPELPAYSIKGAKPLKPALAARDERF